MSPRRNRPREVRCAHDSGAIPGPNGRSELGHVWTAPGWHGCPRGVSLALADGPSPDQVSYGRTGNSLRQER